MEQANRNQESFTRLLEDDDQYDALRILDNSPTVTRAHVRAITDLPQGAPAELESFVQAWLLRHFTANLLAALVGGGGGKTTEQKLRIIESEIAGVNTIKQALIAAGYGQPGDMTPELKATIIHHFPDTGIVPLDFDAHNIQHVPTVDPRKVEVCATFIPGGKLNFLTRAHSFILYTDVSGKMTYISAHDDGEGNLKAEFGLWWPDRFRDKKLTRVVVATGHAASAAFPGMIEAVHELNNNTLSYKMTEQNCNSATHFILKSGNLQAAAPSRMTGAFGWNKKLEKRINRAVPVLPSLPGLPATPTTTASTASTPTTTASGGPTTTTSTITWAGTSPKLTARDTSKAKVLTRARPRAAQGPSQSPSPTPSPTVSPAPSPTVSPRGSAELETPELDEDTHRLLTPLAMGTAEIDAGSIVTVIKLSADHSMAHIKINGRGEGHVSVAELEKAIGYPL